MENLHDKEIATSDSYLLCHYKLYKTVCISSDMNKHKQLVEELKHRRVNEPNLAIRDRVIATRSARQSCTGNQMDTITSTPTVTTVANS